MLNFIIPSSQLVQSFLNRDFRFFQLPIQFLEYFVEVVLFIFLFAANLLLINAKGTILLN